MSDHPPLERIENPGPLRAPRLVAASAGLVVLGAIAFAASLLLYSQEPSRAWGALLMGLMIPTWITAGGLFFIAVHSIGGAYWVVPLRRLMEGLTAGVWVTLIGFLAIALFGMPHLYEWAAAGDARHSLFHAHDGQKASWMTPTRVLATGLLAIAVWIFLRSQLVRLSLRQDQRIAMGRSHARWSVATLILFAFTFTLFVWDMLLSLQAHFISTTWGLYCLVGAIQTFLAVLCIVMWWLSRGPLREVIRPHLARDLGTWMVAWACIWAYIAYTQYVIIYFANTNEEAYFYRMRTQHGYGACYVIEVLLRFPVPFLALLSQRVRGDIRALAAVSALVLVGSWIDLWWMVMPALSPNVFQGFWELPELLIGAGFVGATLLAAALFWRRHGLVPQGDPRLLPAINAEHLH